jgi:hypothetical protein
MLREIFIRQGAKANIRGGSLPAARCYPHLEPVERNYLNKLVKFYQQTNRKPVLDKTAG